MFFFSVFDGKRNILGFLTVDGQTHKLTLTALKPKASWASKAGGCHSFSKYTCDEGYLAPRLQRAARWQQPERPQPLIWSWADLNFMQISSCDAKAAANCRSRCECLPTAWKGPSKHRPFLILHNWRETNICGLRFTRALWFITVCPPWRIKKMRN